MCNIGLFLCNLVKLKGFWCTVAIWRPLLLLRIKTFFYSQNLTDVGHYTMEHWCYINCTVSWWEKKGKSAISTLMASNSSFAIFHETVLTAWYSALWSSGLNGHFHPFTYWTVFIDSKILFSKSFILHNMIWNNCRFFVVGKFEEPFSNLSNSLGEIQLLA